MSCSAPNGRLECLSLSENREVNQALQSQVSDSRRSVGQDAEKGHTAAENDEASRTRFTLMVEFRSSQKQTKDRFGRGCGYKLIYNLHLPLLGTGQVSWLCRPECLSTCKKGTFAALVSH